MLKILRNKKTAKKIWIGLALIIVPAFVLWGSGSLVRNKEESGYIGKLFGRNISVLEFKDALEAARNQMVLQFGDKFAEIESSMNLEAQAWERLLLLYEAKKRRIKAGDKEVVDLIRSYPFFQKKGRFDNAIYAQMLQYVFHTQPRVFEEQTRQNILIFKLYSEMTKDVSVSEAETREAYEKENEELNVSYIASLHTDFAKEVNVDQEEIKDYFARNSLQFKQPLSFNLEYVSLIQENDLEENPEDRIGKIMPRLNKKEDFAKIASDFGLTLKETGLFAQTGPVPEIGWSPEILNLLSKANPGDLFPPVKIDKNYYIMKLKERKEPYVPEFEKIKDKVKDTLVNEKARAIAKGKIEETLKKLKDASGTNPKGIDFEKIARDYGIKSASSDFFKYGSYIEGIGASDKFWSTARELKEDGFSEIIDMPSGFYIIRPKSRRPIDETKFSAEKAEFTQKVLNQKKQEHFLNFFGDLKRRAQTF